MDEATTGTYARDRLYTDSAMRGATMHEQIIIAAIHDPKFLASFWAKVDKSGECWLWTGVTDRCGYGRKRTGRAGMVTAHRISWAIEHGETAGTQHVLHRCDVPRCVNPSHLFAGTHGDNMRDCYAKFHRKSRGQILSADAVRAVRASTETSATLALRYGANETTIDSARSGRTWKRVT